MSLSKIVKKLRNERGISQELLAEESGLSLRTIQRIENNETIPRGDTLKRLAVALNTSPDEMFDKGIKEDQNFLTLLGLSSLSFLIFPLLGIILPFIMWVSKKDKIKRVNEVGKAILNFQISWILILLGAYTAIILLLILVFTGVISSTETGLLLWQSFLPVFVIFYLYNMIVSAFNVFLIRKNNSPKYFPLFRILS